MRKIIIITALCVCAIGIVLIVNKPNRQKSYSPINSNEYNLQKRNISSSNHKEYKGLITLYSSKTNVINNNYHFKRASLKASDKKVNLLNTQSCSSVIHQSLSSNTSTMNKKQKTNTNRLSQDINIEDFSNINSLNSPQENILKTDVYIPMQFAFPDEGQLSNPGETPLNNELILLILAGLFVLYKKK